MLDSLTTGGASTTVGNVREALAGLGYASEEIREAMRDLPDSGSAEDLLRDALRLLGVRRA
jgi:Holliday junction resolvasome RuvABC DNA-binding subunit